MHVLFRKSRPRRRIALAPALVVVVVIAASALSGCAASPAAEEPGSASPTPSLSPEEQDAVAFEDLYAKLLSIDENSETREQLAEVLAPPALEDEVSGAEGLKAAGQHVEGRLTYSGFKVTDQSDTSMVGQVCSWTGGTTVFDSSGRPLPDDGHDKVSLAMKATRAKPDDPWRISEIVRDDGVHACG